MDLLFGSRTGDSKDRKPPPLPTVPPPPLPGPPIREERKALVVAAPPVESVDQQLERMARVFAEQEAKALVVPIMPMYQMKRARHDQRPPSPLPPPEAPAIVTIDRSGTPLPLPDFREGELRQLYRFISQIEGLEPRLGTLWNLNIYDEKTAALYLGTAYHAGLVDRDQPNALMERLLTTKDVGSIAVDQAALLASTFPQLGRWKVIDHMTRDDTYVAFARLVLTAFLDLKVARGVTWPHKAMREMKPAWRKASLRAYEQIVSSRD